MRSDRNISKPLQRLKRLGVDQTSLQLRLTVGITTIALLGVGSIGTWTVWQMRQMLVVDHQKDMNAIAERLQRQLVQEDVSQWQQEIQAWASPSLWIAVQRPDGKLIAQAIPAIPAAEAFTSIALSQTATRSTVQRIDNHRIIACRTQLTQAGRSLGELHLARDITHDHIVFSTLLNTLRFATVLALGIIATLIAMYIWQSLHPLRQVNRMAAVQAENQALPLPTQPIPKEVQGLVQAMSHLSTRLSETGERQREFTNSMSHELRTSLSLIQGYLQSTLRRGDNLTVSQREALEVAASETERTIQLLKDLLDLGRMTSGKMEYHFKPIVLNDAIETTIHWVDPENKRQIQVEAEPFVTVQADVSQLNRVLMHLLKNAMQYSAANQPIQVRLQQTDRWAILQVIDRGCGISAADQPYIFEPFYRVETSRCRATGGIGLGLAIVKSLVIGMNGEVTVASSEQGSTFTVKLPIVSAKAKDQQKF